MNRFKSLQFKLLRVFPLAFILVMSLEASAAQWAIVMSDKAVVYADEQMSAPVGFVRKGKKIKVGDIPRNRAQVYPIMVSGKIGYIRIIDVSTEKESVDSTTLVAERFQKVTEDDRQTNYSLALFNYSTQITLDYQNDQLKDKDALNWYGVSLRGGAKVSPKWDFDLITNFLTGKAEQEVFRMVEFGIGAAAHLYDKGRFQFKALGQLLAVPFSTYAVGDVFRVNGYGYTMGAGLSATFRIGSNIGIETFGGFYYTKLSGFGSPKPYKEISPSFVGSRLGAGLNYQF